MLKKANISWSAKQFVKMMQNGKVTFDNVVQRGYVWDDKRCSLLIHSILTGYPIPALFARKGDDGKYDMLDGKQRSYCIERFLDDQFALTDIPEVVDEDGNSHDYNGKKYSELDDDAKDIVSSYMLTVYYFEDMTDDQVAEMFFRLNNGKPLSAICMTRCKAKSLDKIIELGKHELFTKACTAKSLEKYTNEDIIIKSYAMLNVSDSDICLDTKVIRPLMETVELQKADIKKLNQVFNRIYAAYGLITDPKIARRMMTRTHLISIVPAVWESIEKKYTDQQFADWFSAYFSGTRNVTVDRKYNDYVGSGVNHHDAVLKRKEAVMKSFSDFFSDDKKEKETTGVDDILATHNSAGEDDWLDEADDSEIEFLKKGA
jgi:hypothetical protein